MKVICILTLLVVTASGQNAKVNENINTNPNTARQPGSVYDVRNYGLVCNGIADDTVALSRLLTLIGSSAGTLLFSNGQCAILSTVFSANLTLEFTNDGALKTIVNATIQILGNIEAPHKQIFFNALPGQGSIDFTGGVVLEKVYPEWWGASPSASPATNTPALQAAIYGAFGRHRVNGSGAFAYNRVLHFSGIYDIDAELKAYHMNGFIWEGENKLSAGLRQTVTNSRIIDGQSVSYGSFEQMIFTTRAPQGDNHPLVDLDYSGEQGNDLRPQNITFRDVVIDCNSLAAVGVQLSKSGNAQSDNIRFLYNYGKNCTQAVVQIGTPQVSAQNAMLVAWEGGDIQGSPHYGLFANGGSFRIDGASFENGFASQTGFDVYCTGAAQYPCVIQNTRSESRRLAAGGAINSGLRIINCKTIFQARQWTTGRLAGSKASSGDMVSGDAVGGDGHYYKVTKGGSWGGLGQTAATSGSLTSISDSTATWVANEFSGQRVAIVHGAAANYYCVIASNTRTTINCDTDGWITNYSAQYNASYRLSPPPDNTSRFVIEPNWGAQSSSGSVTFADMSENAIEGPRGGIAPDIVIENSVIMGEQIFAEGRIRNLIVSRADWLKYGHQVDDVIVDEEYSNVRIATPDDLNSFARVWTLPRNNLGAGGYSGVSQYQMGTMPVVWSAGQRGGGSSTRDVWIGGRTDTYGGPNDISRAVLETGGILGRPTPIGADRNGTDMDIQGGLSTGAGVPGNINFWTGSTTSSGSAVVDGAKRWSIVGATGSLLGGCSPAASATAPCFAVKNSGGSTVFSILNNGIISVGSGTTTGILTEAASNSHLAGQLTLVGGRQTHKFAVTYSEPPICVATDTTAPNAVQVSASTTALTIIGTGSDVINYVCVALN